MVNDFICGTQSAICSVDPDWVRRNRESLAAHDGERYVAVALDTHPDLAGIPGITYLRRSHEPGLSDDPLLLRTGGNSGYAAVNLATLKGATDIHLIGYDMDPWVPGTNAHDREKFRQWAPRFRTMLPQLKRLGVRVTNHNPQSRIDAFPFNA